jgi:hypothetical protein
VKCKMCPICLTNKYDLIRNCELRGRYPECIATTLPYVVPTRETSKPKRKKKEIGREQ